MSLITDLPTFVNAIIRAPRLVEEKANLLAPPERMRQANVRLKTQTNSSFQVGVDKPTAPGNFQVQLNFSLSLSDESDASIFMTYESQWAVAFAVKGASEGFDWLRAQETAFAPYFSFVHFLARSKAEAAMRAAGLHGPALPVPDQFTERSNPEQLKLVAGLGSPT